MTIDLTRRVVCAANRCEEFLLVGPRHWDSTMHKQYDLLSLRLELPSHEKFEQGFINTWGEFLTRQEAWQVAVHNDQIQHLVGSQQTSDLERTDVKLYSENLY